MASDCGSVCPSRGILYIYQPNLGGNAFLLAAFALLIPVVGVLGIRFRSPLFAAVLIIGLLLQILGFLGRILLRNVRGSRAYSALTLLGTLLGPTFISSSVFVVLPHTLSIYGTHLSPITPFKAAIFASLFLVGAAVLQLVGVLLLLFTPNSLTQSQSTGMVAGGLALQALCHVTSITLYTWFHQSLVSKGQPLDVKHSNVYRSSRFRLFLRAIEGATALLIAYCIYRIVEMALGVNGTLFQNEVAFMIMNGAFPLLTVILLTAFHPGAAFGSAWAATSPRRARRQAPPPPLRETPGYRPHHRYNPSIRSQISPTYQKSIRDSRQTEISGGSPGLPRSPKPAQKPPSPRTPKMPTPTIDKRLSDRSESQPPVVPKQMVDSEALW
ncbi:RTA1 like protein-domain-containing protein [Stachybotrys elegans]|uniref:RTA1 like protein-domain-containing protein n=1 Tax=Stachybotrys elegans TaxID=80388 RepID=A0A8K0WV62_9HYPO|nr:RTA1 like protein-domain-containing protein [Stachybotrys elegans]